MDSQQVSTVVWRQVAERIAMGEKQTVVARELGMKVGKFRYHLQKFLDQQAEVESGVAATAEASEVEETPVAQEAAKPVSDGQEVSTSSDALESELNRTMHEAKSDVEPRLYAQSLFDDSWTRRWSVSRLVLLVKEPTTVHAYWEVDEQKRNLVAKHFQSRFEDLPLYLQLYDVTDVDFDGSNANYTRRIPVTPDADNWYIHGVQPLRRYLVDFGTTTLTENFFTILRSNIVQTPPPRSYRHPLHGLVHYAPAARSPVDSTTDLVANQSEHVRTMVRVQTEANTVTLLLGNKTGAESDSGSTRVTNTSLRSYQNEFDGYGLRNGRC